MDDLSATEDGQYLAPSERPVALRVSDALRGFVDFVGRWAVVADRAADRHHGVRRDGPQAGLDPDLAGRAFGPDLRIDAAAGARVALPHGPVRARSRLRLHLQHACAGRPDPRESGVSQEGLARAHRPDLLHDSVLPDRDLVRLDLRLRFLGDPRDLGIAGRPAAPLDHQERPGVRPDRRRALRRRRVAAGRDRLVGTAEHPVPADDARVAGGSGHQDRRQGADRAGGTRGIRMGY